MSEEIKVKLSNFDRGIGIFTAINSYKNRKINEQILVQQYNNNKHLSDLKKQMNEANSINKQILANQLKAEQHKEAQKYYKALSYNLFETTDLISKIEDPMVLNYVLNNYYEKIKVNIIESNDSLDEIGDKTFNKQTLDTLNAIKAKAELDKSNYQVNILNNIDNYIADFNKEETRIKSLKKPEYSRKTLNRKKINIVRTIAIYILGFFTYMMLFGIIISPFMPDFDIKMFIPSIFVVMMFGIPYFRLRKKEKKWRSEYDDFYKNELQLQENFQSKKLKLENEYESNILNEKEKLLNHPFYNAIIDINKNHPSFEKELSKIIEVGAIFEKKWGL